MTSRLSCPAIVLRRWPYSESSLVFRALTPQLGTISVLAKGVHKLKSGKIGVIDTWALIELEISRRPRAEMFNLIGCSLLDRMGRLSDDIQYLNVAGILAELAEVAAPTNQSSHDIFLWLQRWLQRLNEGGDYNLILTRAILEILPMLGFAPVFPEVIEFERYWFSPADGGCSIDATADRPNQSARRISAHEIVSLQKIMAADATNLPISLGNLPACITLLGDFLHYHLERLPKAWQMYLESEVVRN
ncbi:MAG: recombinational DNA repair protein (RecF pathway) [Myxococcota bacterium]|jgi:recombinational DNA repair protein (RecF pathway)